KLDGMKAEMLAARTNGLRDVLGLGGGHHEDDVRRRLFQGLEQGVESGVSNLMSFVEDINLVAIAGRAVARGVTQLAYLVDAAIGGRINLDHVNRASGPDLDTGCAYATRLRRWLVSLAIHSAAVQRHGQNTGDRGLADPAMAAENIAVRDALLLNRVFESSGD